MSITEQIVTYFRLSDAEKQTAKPESLSGRKTENTFAVGRAHYAVLNADGTVTAHGNNAYGQCNVDAWKDISMIAAGDYHTVALKKDGTVSATGDNSHGECGTDRWTDIIGIAAGDRHTAGLKSNGTVLAAGDNTRGQCNVGGWRGVIDLYALREMTVAVTRDGELLFSGIGEQKREPSVRKQSISLPGLDPSELVLQETPEKYFVSSVSFGSARVKDYIGTDSTVVIPRFLWGFPVRVIMRKAFQNSMIERIVLPGTLGQIDAYAFRNCTNLETIRIPDSVTEIGESAFLDCTGLETAVLPENLRLLGYGAFLNCPKLKQVYVTERVAKIIMESDIGSRFDAQVELVICTAKESS